VTTSNIHRRRHQYRIVSDLADESHVFVHEDPVCVADGDARRLLAPMLERVQAEIREFGSFLSGGPHPENAAGVLWPGIVRIDFVGETSICAWHGSSVRAAI